MISQDMITDTLNYEKLNNAKTNLLRSTQSQVADIQKAQIDFK